jgi:tripartite-type tricarboxylate transporter receptor subunit TctC
MEVKAMKQRPLSLLIAVVVLSLFVSPNLMFAAPHYEGKTVKMIIGSGAGGAYDQIARLFARHLPKYLPGKPVIVPENMPGASTMIAANHIYNTAKPDGLTIGTFNRGLPFAQLLKVDGVRFDVRKFSWIGSGAVEATVLVLRTELPYKTIDDLKKAKEPIHLAGLGPGASDNQFPSLLKEFLGLNFKMVIYPSGNEGKLAIERKEVDGKAGSYSAFPQMIQRGVVRVLVRGRVSEQGIENIPVDEDLVTDPRGKTVMAMRSTIDFFGRPYVAPPGTPPEVMSLLRDGFAKAAKDPQLQEEARKLMLDIQYVPADECLSKVNYIFSQPEEVVKEFGKYITFQ